MTKILSPFFFCFLTLALSACVHHHQPPPKPKPLVFADWRVEKRSLRETNETPFYQIDVKYPEIVSYPNTASAEELNQQIRTYISTNIQTFKQGAPRDSLDFQDFPSQMRNNEFRITYSATIIKPRQHTIVSIRFKTETLYLTEVTRLHHFAVMNYDLTEGRMLTLDSLFKPSSGYLQVLAKTCQKTLSERLAQGMVWMPWDYKGSLALAENFQIWNLKRRGLEITFQEKQVTPYSSLPQKIYIPYASLRSVLAPGSPVAAYAYY